MPRFIGQPVRIKYQVRPENQHWVGREGRVSDKREGLDEEGKPITTYALDIRPFYQLESDGRVINIGFIEEQLEPIVPEGMKPATWQDVQKTSGWFPIQEKESSHAK